MSGQARPGDGMATRDEQGALFVHYVNDPLQLMNLSDAQLTRALVALESSKERTLASPGLGMYNRRTLLTRADRQIACYRAAIAARAVAATQAKPPIIDQRPSLTQALGRAGASPAEQPRR